MTQESAQYSLMLDRRVHTIEKILLSLLDHDREQVEGIIPPNILSLFSQMKSDHESVLLDVEKHSGILAVEYLEGKSQPV